MSLQCLCVKRLGGALENDNGAGVINAKLSSAPTTISATITSAAPSTIAATLGKEVTQELTISATPALRTKAMGGVATPRLQVETVFKANPTFESSIGGKLIGNVVFSKSQFSSVISLSPYSERFIGDFPEYGCIQKMYPTADVITSNGDNHFISETNIQSNLYQSIDEGIFTGTFHKTGSKSDIVSDANTFITPSSIHTSGEFRYKCSVPKPVVAKDSTFIMRAAAPKNNRVSQTSPEYTISDIKLEAPDGSLLIQYEDIVFRGDADFSTGESLSKGYMTIARKPKENRFLLDFWDDLYPNMSTDTGYTLNFNLSIKDLDDAFDRGFGGGFEEADASRSVINEQDDYLSLGSAPIGSTLNKTVISDMLNHIRITAIEICNSGVTNAAGEKTNLYIEVTPTGHRLEKCIKPTAFKLATFDTGIYPTSSSVWQDALGARNNISATGAASLLTDLLSKESDRYVNLQSTFGVPDSGKLVLEFGHQAPEAVFGLFDGAFAFGVVGSGSFDTAGQGPLPIHDNFFEVESVKLKVKAKKAVGTRDYAIDVVGYSDDGLLNVTSAVGGFLQNGSVGTGSVTISGYNNADHEPLGGTPLGDMSEYYETSSVDVPAGDHYKLSAVSVNSTSFEWYEIPLKIYETNPSVGSPEKYSSTSYFEHINLDIFPLPSGASVAEIELCLNYAPANAIKLHTIGHDDIRIVNGEMDETKVYPTSRQTNDSMLNTGSGFAPISKIEAIPHGFKTPVTAKSNHARRWRGYQGSAKTPFTKEFSLDFERVFLDSPFLSGYFDFNYDDGTSILPREGSLTGTITSTYSSHHLENLGLRFKNSSLFSSNLSTHSHSYETIDWTALVNDSDATDNFTSHELYGRITDGYNNAVRTSGSNSYLDFGDVDLGQAFSMFVRFSPDINVSGASYNLFDSGVIVSKWDNGNDVELLLGYEDEFLTLIAKGTDGTTYKVTDTLQYSGYYYPLSVVATYQSGDPYPLKLYTDNEAENNWDVVRASGANGLEINIGDSTLKVGNSPGSGVGMNMFVTDFGWSDQCNLVWTGANLDKQEANVSTFLENHRNKYWQSGEAYSNDSFKLWDRLNENTRDWKLGAFRYAMFSPDFNIITQRSGRDFVRFNIKSDGDSYINKAQKTMPSNVTSGVAYHTQIENDFLRFNLSDAHANFHSIVPRISKALPRGYEFSERALVVESVIEHKTNNDIVWSDGTIGPKLIVSLYTRNKDPQSYVGSNFGLVNRAIHYLKPSGGIFRLDSTFNENSLFDTSESWAVFPTSKRSKEFNTRYTSEDIDKMFLQYDLVYPSGGAFESTIDIHSAHIRLEHAFVKSDTANIGGISGIILHTSGEKRERESMPLYFLASSGLNNLWGDPASGPYAVAGGSSSGMILHTIYNPIQVSGWSNLYTSGSLGIENGFLNLHTATSSGLDNLWGDPAGANAIAGGSSSGVILFTSGEYRSFSSINAYLHNTSESRNGTMNLAVSGSISGAYGIMPLIAFNGYSNGTSYNQNMSLASLGSSKLSKIRTNRSINLFVKGPHTPSGSLNLFVSNERSAVTSSGSANLHTINYSYDSGVNNFVWDSRVFGAAIDVDDNSYAGKDADDEIRGVELICYGDCNTDSDSKCTERPIITHDTSWIDSECITGGIFRAKNTYVNLDHSYSGDYYGIRKFTGLVPKTPYDITIKAKTGSTKPVTPPREWEEWEYGSNEDVNYSGIKLVGNYPHAESGRNENDQYGKSIGVYKDLMLVGAPAHRFDENGSGILDKAGAVFAYRRTTPTTSGTKYGWSLEQKITLPSGFRQPYYAADPSGTKIAGNFIETRSHRVGQKGREFGHSLAVSASGDRQVAVIGAPGAVWSGSFDEIVTNKYTLGAMVFTDEFRPTSSQFKSIAGRIAETNQILRYFSSPPVELDIKLVVCESKPFEQNPPSLPDWIYHQKIDRNNVDGATTASILSGIKEGFNSAFPFDNTARNSGLPPVLGLYVDPTPSFERSSIEPAIDQFISYYQDYTFLSGVVDINDNQSSGVLHEHFIQDSEKDPMGNIPESWAHYAQTIVLDIMDSGILTSSEGFNLISSGVGPDFANPELEEFNIAAPSGGRVYVYEKIGEIWDLIQEISSASEELMSPVDRFGHSVSISENCEVITIGSPFLKEDNCLVYEYKPEQRIKVYDNLLTWLKQNNTTGKYDTAIASYGTHASTMSDREALKKVYSELSATDRFTYRKDIQFFKDVGVESSGLMGIEEYKKAYKYDYSDITYTGTWGFVADEFAGTSRLGYSTAINEDGSIVAFGAPTDSFNEFDDTNVWYRKSGIYGFGEDAPRHWFPLDGWASTTNTGAVRVFESRKYHPHSGVAEYFKFGNLHRSSNPHLEASGSFNLSGVHEDRQFTQTQFADVDIPKDAGLVYIITPEIDAASDEVVNNIKEWMALGDRTLVLVGDDPTWESNGIYQRSNDIINKILSKLGSEMRLHPARSESESLPICPDSGRPNTIKSKDPRYSRSTHIPRYSMYAKGVADIRMHIPEWDGITQLNGPAYTGDCELGVEGAKLNEACPIPMLNGGDLRAQKVIECSVPNSDPKKPARIVKEYINWPWVFGNGQVGCSPKQGFQGIIGRPNQEPKPLIAAAEYIPASAIIYPAYKEKTLVPVYGEKVFKKNKTVTKYNFAEQHIGKVFELKEPEFSGVNYFKYVNYIDPASYLGRDSFAQGVASSKSLPISEDKVIQKDSPVIAEQLWQYLGRSSKVVLIATLRSEKRNSLYGGQDDNILLYQNIVRKECPNYKGRIAQLGGWTNRTTFDSAYEGSVLKTMLNSKGYSITENITGTISSIYDVCWVANPDGNAEDTDIEELKTFLNEGEKTLVITYDLNQGIARNVYNLCKSLGLDMHPLYLNNLKKFATTSDDSLAGQGKTRQISNNTSSIVTGCDKTQRPSHFYLDSDDKKSEPLTFGNFIPISVGDQASYVFKNTIPIRDSVTRTETIWQMKAGVASMKAPVALGSGYRLFYSWVAEDDTEYLPIKLYLEGVNPSPDPEDETPTGVGLDDYNDDDQPFSVSENITMSGSMSKPGLGVVKTSYIDFKVPPASESSGGDTPTSGSLFAYFDSNNLDLGQVEYLPHTVRIFGVSGCLLPIETKTETTTTEEKKQVIVGWKEVIKEYPERKFIIPEKFQPIKTIDDKYCRDGYDVSKCESATIDDGPIIVAEEVEKFSSFTAGKERSKIVLISDANIVQNECGLIGDNADFLRGLYPTSLDASKSFVQGLYQNLDGRNFEHVQKIKSPELGSPFRYHSASGLDELSSMFGGFSVRQGSGFFSGEQNPSTLSVERPSAPETEEKKRAEISRFGSRISTVAGSSSVKFSGIIARQGPTGLEYYMDAGKDGGIPEIIAASGSDYLDSDLFQSGYPGDLFGISISMSENNLVVGSPYNGFTGESVVAWSDINFSGNPDAANQFPVSGLELCGKGGAGAVFYYQKTGSGTNAMSSTLPWQFKQKIKPSSINVGHDSYSDLVDSQRLLGSNNYTASDLSNMITLPDEFGMSVSIDADFLAVGAPKHDYENHHEHIYTRDADGNATTTTPAFSGQFIRKAFNSEFDIPKHKVYDLGSSGVRVETDWLSGSGTSVLNNGAVFTFENKMQSWFTGEKEWQYAEKIVAQGNKARTQKSYTSDFVPVAISGSESDNFGKSVSINRARRSDSDYTLAIGAPHHMFSSGNVVADEPMLDAGAAYTFDAMLREQPKITPAAGSFIVADVYGDASGIANVNIKVDQPLDGAVTTYTASGRIFSNHDGEIFIQGSGKDMASRGFIKHRPYIESVEGVIPVGETTFSAMRMFTSGSAPISSGNINLYLLAPASGTVYNNIVLHTSNMNLSSGSMNLVAWCPSGIPSSGSMNLFTSGAGITTENVNLRVRGK